jgi:LysR family transcriptional regulator, nitrogen assimilation regulatory protein
LDIATILIINSLLSTCSIRETARLEGRAPSTVSAALERMETALAVPLIRRDGAVLSLTLEAEKRLSLFEEVATLGRRLLFIGVGADRHAAITLTALTRFTIAAKAGSIRAAAKNLGIGQPQLTRQLSELERNLNCGLFDRTRTGVTCTIAGETALAIVESIVGKWGELSHASSDRFRYNLATCKIGSVMPLGHESNIAQILANLTVGWERLYPRQPLSISANTAEELISGLKSRRYDAILIDHDKYSKDFDGRVISDAPLALIGDHRVMAKLQGNVATFLQEHPIALPSEKSGIRQHAMLYLESVLDRVTPSKLRLIEMDSIPVIINLVTRHGYLSILPEPVVARLPFPITQIPLGDEHRQILSFVWRRNTFTPAMLNEMISLLIEDIA